MLNTNPYVEVPTLVRTTVSPIRADRRTLFAPSQGRSVRQPTQFAQPMKGARVAIAEDCYSGP